MERATRLAGPERRQQIINAAREVFLKQGIAGAGTRQLAEAAGINSALLYHYFESKEAIFEAAVLEPLHGMVAEIFSIGLRMSAENIEDRVREIDQGIVRMVKLIQEALPFLGLVLFSEEEMGRRFYLEHLDPLLMQSYESGVRGLEGWADAPVLPWMMKAIFGMCLAMAMDYHFHGREIDDDELAATLGQFVVRALPLPLPPAAVSPKATPSKRAARRRPTR